MPSTCASTTRTTGAEGSDMKRQLWGGLWSVIIAAVALLASAPVNAAAVLITGSSTGIGLEFAKQYAARGWTVYATHHFAEIPQPLVDLNARYPQLVHIELLDVTRDDHVAALAAKLMGKPIDVLLNNAAIKRNGRFRDRETNKEQYFGTLDFDAFHQFLDVNTAGPLRVVQGFIANVRLGEQKKLVTISSSDGSVSVPPGSASDYWYRISKAALNQAMRLLAVEFRDQGIIVATFHPGRVAVESFEGQGLAGLTPTPAAVGRMMKVIDGLTGKDSGRFMNNEGRDLPW
jgi:NAD(P)-dependent dehydrogenase (short-subunit alcohol dehydrogenase family)